jgi:hypothetical protein
MTITFGMKESSYLCSQIAGSVENAVPLHTDIPHTCRRGFDLPSEDALQEYLKYPYETFLSVLPPEGYCCKLCPLNNHRKKSHGLKSGMCWPNITADNSAPENIGQSLHTHMCMCSVGSI